MSFSLIGYLSVAKRITYIIYASVYKIASREIHYLGYQTIQA